MLIHRISGCAGCAGVRICPGLKHAQCARLVREKEAVAVAKHAGKKRRRRRRRRKIVAVVAAIVKRSGMR
jgi:hypothetical protein